MTEKDNTSVQVALRVRPLVPSELSRGCKESVEVFQEHKQIRIKNTDKAFTYNHVFGPDTEQDIFYTTSVAPMLENLYNGYNVTILAYGQTGSGKTHSMGTAYNGDGDMGVIPRAIADIFNYVKDNFSYDFTIGVTFMELYQEVLYDLLSVKSREQSVVEIREDINKSILIPGLTEQLVMSSRETLECLLKGSKGRATSSTNMNTQSSRSHAIFTINIAMQKKGTSDTSKTAKFHLVDLAGSERSKKTGATGQTFKEGVNINRGLLALGNVISALGDDKGQSGFIGYRDSNLTRLLKDSLGGNSITLMIACVSPADYNIEETLSTLRYSDRARKIKNKPIVNEDPKAAEINRLHKLVQQLRLELIGQGGPIICQAELELLNKELLDSKIKNKNLNVKLSITVNENTALLERLLIIQSSNECLAQKLQELKDVYNVTLGNLNQSLEQNDVEGVRGHVTHLKSIQNQLIELDKEHKKSETEIRKHEISVARNNIDSDPTAEKEICERQETHTAQQMEMNTQLQKVNTILAQKEQLAQQIAANTCNLVDFTEFAENEAKIAALEKEKNELLLLLKSVQDAQVQEGSVKVTEQRKKRVKELEGQIQDLNRKVREQARLIKLKEKDELKIKQLNNEIYGMKATKVTLIKNMRKEAEKFRSWRIQRERELSKLKDHDRKLQNQIVKMETIHSRQQNVLKRKVEEAAAINKRLKDALALRKAAQDTKLNGKIERFGPWIQRELDVFISTVEAKSTLEVLLEDRATLQQQLDQLKERGVSSISQFEDDLELRSLQIQELQQKILDSDEENKIKSRFDNLQTMSEAKYVLKVLFDSTAEIKRKEATRNYEIQTEIEQKIKDESTKLETKFRTELSNLERDHEEKVSVLLRQLRGVQVEDVDEEVNQRCCIQLNTIDKLETNVQTLTKENEALTARIDEINRLLKEKSDVTPPKRKKKTNQDKENNDMNATFLKPMEIISDYDNTPSIQITYAESSFEEDLKDPDWRNTPLAKRVQKMRSTTVERLPSKRNSRGGCTCRGTCGTRTCGCKKFGISCNLNCKCATDACVNKESLIENEETFVSASENTNDEDDASLKESRTDRRKRKLYKSEEA